MNDADKAGRLAVQQAMNNLHGMIMGIGYDKAMGEEEQAALKKWVEDNGVLKGTPAYDSCSRTIKMALADHLISYVEYLNLLEVSSVLNLRGEHETDIHSIEILSGIIQGILADGNIHEKEAKALHNWLSDNLHLEGTQPFDLVFPLLQEILMDRHMDEEEAALLKKVLQQYI